MVSGWASLELAKRLRGWDGLPLLSNHKPRKRNKILRIKAKINQNSVKKRPLDDSP